MPGRRQQLPSEQTHFHAPRVRLSAFWPWISRATLDASDKFMNYDDADRQFSRILETLLGYGRQGIPFGSESYVMLLGDAEGILESMSEETRLQLLEHRKVELKLLRLTATAQVQANSTAA
jgi:hypothetical protein